MATKKSFPTWAIVLGVVVLLGLWLMSSYNKLISAEQNKENAWAQVETEYQRRFDAIPNLVSIVQGAADFEQDTLVAVTEARTNWLNTQADPNASVDDQIAASQSLDSAFSRLLVSVEAYPTLTATAGFQSLQVQLEGTENRITVARQDFNDSATEYNLIVKRFPGNLVAGLFGFDASPLFQSDSGAEDAPVIDFSSTPSTNETTTTAQ